MELKPIGHQYSVINRDDGSYAAVMILSEHDNLSDALGAMLKVMKEESKEIMSKEIEKLRAQGISAVTFEEAIKDMTPEELERFLEERRRKFINPLLDKNREILEQKKKIT